MRTDSAILSRSPARERREMECVGSTSQVVPLVTQRAISAGRTSAATRSKTNRGLPLLTLGLAIISVGLHLLPGVAVASLQFERSAIAAGEWWRAVTGHLTHFDANHLAWDVGALLVLGTLCETSSRRRTAVALGLASVAISAAVWTFQPQFESYRGLSGLDSALFALFASSLIEQRRRAPVILGVVALLGVLAKSIFEIVTGTPAFASGNGYLPVPLAHLVGVLCGSVVALILSDGRASPCSRPSCRTHAEETANWR